MFIQCFLNVTEDLSQFISSIKVDNILDTPENIELSLLERHGNYDTKNYCRSWNLLWIVPDALYKTV